MKVWIAQLLCPARHCMLALAKECEDAGAAAGLTAAAAEQFAALKAAGTVKEQCAVCGSETFRIETAPTVYKTMAEALPALKKLEAAQRLSAAIVRATKQIGEEIERRNRRAMNN